MKVLGHGANVDEMASLYGKDPKDIIDFSSNINPKIPAGLETKLQEALRNAAAYPDIHYTRLRSEIAQYLGVEAEEIIVGNGATEIMYLLMKALKENEKLSYGGTLGIINPTFSEYERSAKLSGIKIKDFYLEETGLVEDNEQEGRTTRATFKINKEKLMADLDKVDALFICNPNNPTGNVQHLEEVLQIMADKEKLLIVDETFMEFVAAETSYSLVSKVKEYKNLIIIKAVTKFFGLPGLRLGYGVSSHKALLKAMYEYKEPWTVNSFAEALTPMLFQDAKYMKDSKDYFQNERQRMLEALGAIKGLKVYQTDTNFILIKLTECTAAQLKMSLFEKYSLLLRDASNFKGLDAHFIRVAIKSQEENNQLISALREEFKNELY